MEQTAGSCSLDKDMAMAASARHSLSMLAKRTLDVAVAALSLAALTPLLAVVCLAIRLAMGAPVLFRQYRVGLGGRPFILLKFRTMRHSDQRRGVASGDRERTTRLGRFLRNTKIDELPELLNVLRGEMSLVGPRPLMPETEDYYVMPYARKAWVRRHDVRPGLTGWGQVCGNTNLAFSQRFALDVWYIDHRSLWFDAKVVVDTLRVVLLGERPSAAAVAAAETYVYSERERAQVRQEARSGDLPAPVGRAVVGLREARSARQVRELREATGLTTRGVPSRARKAWVRPSVIHRSQASPGARIARLTDARPGWEHASGDVPTLSGAARVRRESPESEARPIAAGLG